MATDKTLFSDDFLDNAARDIWQSARLHAQERKSGTVLNPKKQTDRIRREIQGAAAIIATELLERQAEFKDLREKIGELKGEIKAVKAQLVTVKKDLDLSSKELRCVKEDLVEAKSKANPSKATAKKSSGVALKGRVGKAAKEIMAMPSSTSEQQIDENSPEHKAKLEELRKAGVVK